jgi:hypothetical protein
MSSGSIGQLSSGSIRWVQSLRPNDIPSSSPNGASFSSGRPASSSVRYGTSGCVRSRRVVLLERVPLELGVHEDAAQVGVPAELHAAHVERLALEPVGARPDRVTLSSSAPFHVLVADARLQADAVPLSIE